MMFAVALTALALTGTAASVPVQRRHIEGTPAGRAVSRSHSGGFGDTVQCWARFLGF